MIWQDFVLMFVAFGFGFLLLPTLRDSTAAVPRTTSIPTTGLLIVLASTFATMDMWLAFAGNVFTAVCWAQIALYRTPGSVEGCA